MDSDRDDLGPAMLELNERQRKFVLAMVELPGRTHADAARLAGYSDHLDAAKVRGFYLAHNPVVQAAIREEAGKRLNANTLVAADVLVAIMADPGAKHRDKLKAAGMLLDRTGFGASQTINVNKTVTRKMDVSAAAQKIAEFRQRFPEQFAKLLGGEAPVIEGEFSEVEKNHA